MNSMFISAIESAIDYNNCFQRMCPYKCVLIFYIYVRTVNVVTIVILSRGKCGLSEGVTRYLVAMVAADQLVVLFDLVLSKIPVTYWPIEFVNWSGRVRVCNIHAVLFYAATDCSVWFTVTFTFDRFVAICFQELKRRFCTGRAAALVLGTVTVLICLKNICWYFMLDELFSSLNRSLICLTSDRLFSHSQLATFLLIHFLLTPIFPFVLILLLNSLTIRHVFVASRARRRLRGSRVGETAADPEMKNRRKSLLLLLVMSGNFILLWALLTVCSVWESLIFYIYSIPPESLRELGYMLQLLSCCTNTALYAVVQARFREQLKETVKSPLRLMAKCTRRCQDCINAR
ncbi:probable G-protein coupled receptor 139 [Mobula hypostoma]|uniref:probable G-protein coupled receptor 139 n=1 Tax=Mobula hypostoma TaxID=723540 RepID=UPI002FC384B5